MSCGLARKSPRPSWSRQPKLIERPGLAERVGPIGRARSTAPQQRWLCGPARDLLRCEDPARRGRATAPGGGTDTWSVALCAVRPSLGRRSLSLKSGYSSSSQQLPQAACRELTLAPAERGRESRNNVISPSNVSSLYSNSCGLREYLVGGTVVVIHWEINRFSPLGGAFHL